ncbi:MAG: hypothetical protein IKB27_01805 [Clostridia bacterium]|nr:hypothetical protein [Clostridia bacterium]
MTAKKAERLCRQKLEELLNQYGAELVEFIYLHKCFGNAEVRFIYKGTEQWFGIDRWDLWYNHKRVWMSSCFDKNDKKRDTFAVLLNLIKEFFETGDVKKKYKYDWE